MLFSDSNVPLNTLKKRAFNFRWAETDNDVIPLTAADPDFPVANEIRNAIIEYTKSGVFSYGPHLGLDEFKQALANAFNSRRGYSIDSSLILPIDSAASGMYAIARACITEGDEAIIFDPVDFLFEQSVKAAGGKVIRCPFNSETQMFALEQLPSLITSKTKMIGVCNPHNPLGRTLNRSELEIIANLANSHNFWIMNDEIWSDIVFSESPFCSFHQLPKHLQKNLVTAYGFSKAFGLAGLRVGAIIAENEEIFQKIVHSSNVMTTAGGVSTLSQIAAITALNDCQYWVDEFLSHLTEQRNYAVSRLNKMPGIHCELPQATYLLFPNITKTGLTADSFVEHCLRNKVALVPGNKRFFGPGAHGHIRICFATSRQLLSQGLDRIEQSLLQLMEAA